MGISLMFFLLQLEDDLSVQLGFLTDRIR
jgi:hypothetical protein